jgi:hypothetical protein
MVMVVVGVLVFLQPLVQVLQVQVVVAEAVQEILALVQRELRILAVVLEVQLRILALRQVARRAVQVLQ